jgi:hypothetical protein
MKLKQYFISFLVFFWPGACKHQPAMLLTQNINLDGKYQFDEVPGNKRLRDWGRKYWELTINGDKGTLYFDDVSHGIESFEMAVNISQQDDRVILSLDSLLWEGYLVDNLHELKHGEQLMTFQLNNGYLYSNFDNSAFSNLYFITRRQAKFERVL